MTYILTFLIIGVCVAAMAVGLLIANKTLKKGCSDSPEDCACRAKGKDPSTCDK